MSGTEDGQIPGTPPLDTIVLLNLPLSPSYEPKTPPHLRTPHSDAAAAALACLKDPSPNKGSKTRNIQFATTGIQLDSDPVEGILIGDLQHASYKRNLVQKPEGAGRNAVFPLNISRAHFQPFRIIKVGRDGLKKRTGRSRHNVVRLCTSDTIPSIRSTYSLRRWGYGGTRRFS